MQDNSNKVVYTMKVCDIEQVGYAGTDRISDITLDAHSDKTGCKLTKVEEYVARRFGRNLYGKVRVTIEFVEE